jgi:malonyl CoA-acyl carrier protein transacylase
MTVAYLFPGQGAQHVGMGAGLLAAYPNIVRQADDVLGYSIAELCANGPKARLTRTRFAQCALYVVEVISYLEAVRADRVLPDFVAGHSVGEYAALFAAGAYTFRAGLEIVAERARLMANAGPGAMAAVIGLDESRVRHLLRENGGRVDIAAVNAADQIVISGPHAAVDAASEALRGHVRSVVRLEVSGAFHSRWMADVAAAFEGFLQRREFAPLKIPVIANVTGQPYEDNAIALTLARQLTMPVRWLDTMNCLLGKPEPSLREIGPSDVLERMTQRIRAGSPRPFRKER